MTQKVEIAIGELNQAGLQMYRQMQSGKIDKPLADKSIFAAQRKAKAAAMLILVDG